MPPVCRRIFSGRAVTPFFNSKAACTLLRCAYFGFAIIQFRKTTWN